MGGRVGLTGTVGRETLARARALGAAPVAPARAARAFALLRPLAETVELLAPPGTMGAELLRAVGLAVREVGRDPAADTSPEHTREAAEWMQRLGAELLLFAGGDGTARDILGVIGGRVPMLGIPTGVKMHSAVFAASPDAAGEVACAWFAPGGARIGLREAEVMDLDEEAIRAGRVSARLFGHAQVPHLPRLVQNAKAGPRPDDEAEIAALAGRLAAGMAPGRLYLLGPGTSTRRIAERLTLPKTLLGVDAILDRRLLAADLNENALLALLDEAPRPVTLIVGVTGGQGFLFGRGNQQLSPPVLRRIGRENIIVMAGAGKLGALDPPWLRADTGDPETDRWLSGYRRVETGPDRSMIMRLVA
ncbi:MAG: NAD(+)/NADH kinase [Alphaproteobacteria bacterium]|nr:NAD(+)/NADH kinase [Alphaproteobacteria bacterium]